jgi:hypothetical protein
MQTRLQNLACADRYVLQIAASAALFSSALNSTGKQITTSRLDPRNHLVEHVAAGHASTVPQTILNARFSQSKRQ